MKGNQGKIYLAPFSAHTSSIKAFEKYQVSTAKLASKAAGFLVMKCKELAGCHQGPLVEAKGKMEELQLRVSQVQKKLSELRAKVQESKKEYTRCEDAEKQALNEARELKLMVAIQKDVSEQLEPVEAADKQLNEVLAPLSGSEVEAIASPSSLKKEADELMAALKEKVAAMRKAMEKHSAVKKATKGPLSEARQSVVKAIAKAEMLRDKAASAMEVADSFTNRVAEAAFARVKRALRTEALKKGSLDAFFKEMAEGEVLSTEAFQRQIASMADLNLSAEQAQLAISHVSKDGEAKEGISRWRFLQAMQQYYVCVKPIALTADFVIGKSKPQRMLSEDEVIELLEGPLGDEKLGIQRIKGRALIDNVVGWISLSGNQGSVFLKEIEKPFMHCTVDLPMEENFRNSSEAPLRTLKAEEVIEVLEGPRKDILEPALRAHCKVCSDGTTGWFTIKSSDGTTLAEEGSARYFICTTAIAMTDNQNIKACKVTRKLEVSEIVRLIEGPVTDQDSGVTRIKASSTKDGIEGWVTVKGNAGTTYAEEKSKICTMLRDVPLHKKFASEGAEVLRMLRKDEAVEVLEEPKEEKFDAVVRVKGRALADGLEGWLSRRDRKLVDWAPIYKCCQSTVIQTTLATKGAALLRKLEEGEDVEALEGPKEDKEVGLLRIRGKAKKDGLSGWMTLKGNQGTVYLSPSTRPQK